MAPPAGWFALDEQALRTLRHDLRGHLNLIRLSTHTLELGGNCDELIEWVDHIEQAADDALATMDKLDELLAGEA